MTAIPASFPLTQRNPIYSKFIQDPAAVQQKLNKELRFAIAQQIHSRPQTHAIPVTRATFRMSPQSSFHSASTQTNSLIETETHAVGPYQVRIASAQGLRPTMEDEHIAQMITVDGREIPLFGVFDGHAGNEASKFLKENLPRYLTYYLDKFSLSDTGIWNALKHALIELDYDFNIPRSGSTAVIALLIDNHIWTANVGDSRALLSAPTQAIQLSEDAKPSDPRYYRSIQKRGGTLFNHYVYGVSPHCGIAVARVFGDHNVASPSSTSVLPHAPKITKQPILPSSTLVLACDGVWDVATSDQVSLFTQLNHTPAQLIGKALNAGSTDNLTLLSVRLSNP